MSANHTIPNDSVTRVEFDTVEFDDGDGFNSKTNVWTAPQDGRYRFTAVIGYSTLPNGTQILSQINTPNNLMAIYTVTGGSSPDYAQSVTHKQLTKGDKVFCQAYQNGGNGRDVNKHRSFFEAIRTG